MQHTFQPELPQPPLYCSQIAPASNITPHKAACCCVIAACEHCGEFGVQHLCACQPEQNSHCPGSSLKCPLLNHLKDGVSARGIHSTGFSSSVIHLWYCGSEDQSARPNSNSTLISLKASCLGKCPSCSSQCANLKTFFWTHISACEWSHCAKEMNIAISDKIPCKLFLDRNVTMCLPRSGANFLYKMFLVSLIINFELRLCESLSFIY